MTSLETINAIVRERFKNMLEDTGISMKFFCDKTGMSYSTLSKWKGGKFTYSLENLKLIEKHIAKLMTRKL